MFGMLESAGLFEDDDLLNVEEIDNEVNKNGGAEVSLGGGEGGGEGDLGGGEGGGGESDPEAEKWQALVGAIGDIPEDEKLLDTLTPEAIQKMGPTERGLARLALGRLRKESQLREKAHLERVDEYRRQNEAIEAERAKLREEKRKLASVYQSEDVKKYLAEADAIDKDKLDLTTPEGRRKFMQAEAAEGVRKLAAPIINAATREEKQAQYRDFVAAHPEMKDPEVVKAVVAIGKKAKEAGQAIAMEDAYHRVMRQRAAKAKADELQRKREQAALSARHVGKRTISSTPKEKPLTKDRISAIKKQGYTDQDGNKHTGEMALVYYLRDNPEAKKALNSRRRAG